MSKMVLSHLNFSFLSFFLSLSLSTSPTTERMVLMLFIIHHTQQLIKIVQIQQCVQEEMQEEM